MSVHEQSHLISNPLPPPPPPPPPDPQYHYEKILPPDTVEAGETIRVGMYVYNDMDGYDLRFSLFIKITNLTTGTSISATKTCQLAPTVLPYALSINHRMPDAQIEVYLKLTAEVVT